MGDDRKRQILQAFETCIGRNGIDGTTLADVAQEAGLQRTLVYHYFRDREQLIESLIEYIDESFLLQRFSAISDSHPEQRLALLLDYVFSNAFSQRTGEGADAYAELVHLGTRDERVRRKLNEMLRGWLARLETSLADDTGASREQCAVVAYAVTCLFEHNATMQLLGFGEEQHRMARTAAEALINLLRPLAPPLRP